MNLNLNTQLRAARMMAAGRVTCTFRSPSGQHITLSAKARGKNAQGKWKNLPLADSSLVFIEVPNSGGWGDKVGKITGRGFIADPNADPARIWCAGQLLKFLAGEPTADGLEIFEEERCGACGRALTDPVSIERGIGPECYGRLTGSQHEVKTRDEVLARESALALETERAAGRDATRLYGSDEPRVEDAIESFDLQESLAAARSITRTDRQGVALGVGSWRARKEYAAEAVAAESDAPRLSKEERRARLLADCSQVTGPLPGTTFEDIFA